MSFDHDTFSLQGAFGFVEEVLGFAEALKEAEQMRDQLKELSEHKTKTKRKMERAKATAARARANANAKRREQMKECMKLQRRADDQKKKLGAAASR